LIASDHPAEEVVARWRGLRRDADVLREHASANPEAAERLERAIAALEEKEQAHAQQRARLEQDNLRRLQQLARQVEVLAASEQLSLKAGDRALREIRAALDERAPLPTKQDRQDIQRREQTVVPAYEHQVRGRGERGLPVRLVQAYVRLVPDYLAGCGVHGKDAAPLILPWRAQAVLAGSAVETMAAFTSAGVQPGCRSSTSAATPATCGAAMDVPLATLVVPPGNADAIS
jgi:hypothetical protein